MFLQISKCFGEILDLQIKEWGTRNKQTKNTKQSNCAAFFLFYFILFSEHEFRIDHFLHLLLTQLPVVCSLVKWPAWPQLCCRKLPMFCSNAGEKKIPWPCCKVWDTLILLAVSAVAHTSWWGNLAGCRLDSEAGERFQGLQSFYSS